MNEGCLTAGCCMLRSPTSHCGAVSARGAPRFCASPQQSTAWQLSCSLCSGGRPRPPCRRAGRNRFLFSLSLPIIRHYCERLLPVRFVMAVVCCILQHLLGIRCCIIGYVSTAIMRISGVSPHVSSHRASPFQSSSAFKSDIHLTRASNATALYACACIWVP